MMKKNLLPRLVVVLLMIVGIASCEEDFTTIQTNIINESFNREVDSTKTVIAYSKAINGVQTNNQTSYRLGVYNDAVYGKSHSHLLAQIEMGADNINPTFGDCAVLDSVVLYFPFFGSSMTDSEDVVTYDIDSIFGNGPIDINIYESDYFLRPFDPDSGFEDPQLYYSNQGPEFEANLGPLLATVTDWAPSDDAIVLNDSVSMAPGLRVNLPVDFFQEKIMDMEGESELLNNNNFREYFRGLYFEVSTADPEGSMVLFDIAETDDEDIGIIMYTSYVNLEDGQTCDNNDAEILNDETRFFFTGISVNALERDFPGEIQTALANSDPENGNTDLYTAGGEGILTLIELFGEDTDGNGIADELEELRAQEWLINEANLIFYVDQDRVEGGGKEPERIFIYDTRNNTVLADYFNDFTSNNVAVDAITEHMGRLERGSDGNGDFYRMRITSHVSNLINNDSINAPLGLMVTQSVINIAFAELESPLVPKPGVTIEEVPATCVLSPEGTVLFGNTAPDPSKRLKLEIYYTEPE